MDGVTDGVKQWIWAAGAVLVSGLVVVLVVNAALPSCEDAQRRYQQEQESDKVFKRPKFVAIPKWCQGESAE